MGVSAPELVVGDFVTLQRGTTYKGNLVGEPGPALLGLGSIEPGGGFRHAGFKTYGGDCPEHLMLRPGDIYVALKGATKDGSMIGSVARVPRSVGSGRLTQDTAKLELRKPHPEIARHLYWVLRTPQYRDYCAGRAIGTSAVALSRQDFLSFPIPQITPVSQQLIALLEDIEAKLTLNEGMNRTLEEVARAVFKSWFVDFDPVRAKSEGRDRGLPESLSDLFPARLVNSELGEIPEGWEVKHLDDLAAIRGGKQMPADEYRQAGKYPVFGANGIMGYADRASHAGFVIVFGRVGANCGSVHWTYGGAWINNNASSVLPTEWPEFVLQAMLMADFEPMRTGSAQPFIPNSSLASMNLVRPTDTVLDAFCSVVRLLRLRQEGMLGESRTLVAVRDTLLPKLMSGQVRVTDARLLVDSSV